MVLAAIWCFIKLELRQTTGATDRHEGVDDVFQERGPQSQGKVIGHMRVMREVIHWSLLGGGLRWSINHRPTSCRLAKTGSDQQLESSTVHLFPDLPDVAQRHGAMREAVDEQGLQESFHVVEGVTYAGQAGCKQTNRHTHGYELQLIHMHILTVQSQCCSFLFPGHVFANPQTATNLTPTPNLQHYHFPILSVMWLKYKIKICTYAYTPALCLVLCGISSRPNTPMTLCRVSSR